MFNLFKKREARRLVVFNLFEIVIGVILIVMQVILLTIFWDYWTFGRQSACQCPLGGNEPAAEELPIP